MAEAVQSVLIYFLLPVWFLAGIADWLCHRATDIEHTTGAKESVIHLLMFGEIAVPLVACLFLDINALVFLIMIAAFLAHEATALWDVSYAVERRWVSPIEQHVHSFLEMIPLMAGLLIALLHWPQLLALFGLAGEPPRFALQWKDPPLPFAVSPRAMVCCTVDPDVWGVRSYDLLNARRSPKPIEDKGREPGPMATQREDRVHGFRLSRVALGRNDDAGIFSAGRR